jgi:hypothetical protein
VGDTFDVPVAEGGETLTWTLALDKPERHQVALALRDPFGRAWEATGGDVFDALMKLRLQAERDGIQICCNGARRNAWSSGMQRDMGEGYVVYLLRAQKEDRPPEVRTLDPAPAEEVVSVAEQRAFFEDYSGHPLPNDDAS